MARLAAYVAAAQSLPQLSGIVEAKVSQVPFAGGQSSYQ
jgi:hypothetical protein